MPKVYTIEHFIWLFNSLPDDYISVSTNTDDDSMDAWEWIATRVEEDALYDIVEPYGILLAANDGMGGYALLGNTPKQRILKFLTMIKDRMDNDEKILQSLQESTA